MLYCLNSIKQGNLEAGILAYRTSLKKVRAGIQSRNLEAVVEQTMEERGYSDSFSVSYLLQPRGGTVHRGLGLS